MITYHQSDNERRAILLWNKKEVLDDDGDSARKRAKRDGDIYDMGINVY